MGKAALRKWKKTKDYLVRLSYEDPAKFECEWDKRMGSWLETIRHLSRQWPRGEELKGRLFDIVDRAMEVMDACDGRISRAYGPKTFGQLSHECAARLAIVIDPRLYRLSNRDSIEKAANETRT